MIEAVTHPPDDRSQQVLRAPRSPRRRDRGDVDGGDHRGRPATGARSVWLGVNNENARANRFYEKHGFAIVGDKHFRLGDRMEDDYVRELVLGAEVTG